jgi:hypothetical protein
MAVCLMCVPAASAALFPLPGVTPVRHLLLPDTHHGVDWNVFTVPAFSPLDFMDERRIPVLEAIRIEPRARHFRPVVHDIPRETFGSIVTLLACLLTAMRGISRVHVYRTRFRSLNLRLPVH